MTETSQSTTLIAATLRETTRLLPTLKQSISLEENYAPRLPQGFIFLLFLMLSGLIGLSAMTTLHQKVECTGEIIAGDKVKVVQPKEGGTITDLMIQEGDLVKQGQPLIILESSAVKKELDVVVDKEQHLQIVADRFRAFGLNQNFDTSQYSDSLEKIVADQKSIYDLQVRAREDQRLNLMNQLDQRRFQLDLILGQEHDIRQELEAVEQQRDMAKKLYEKKLGTGADYRKTEENLSKLRNDLNGLVVKSQEKRQEITEIEGRIVELDTAFRNNALAEMEKTTTELTTLNAQKESLKDRLEHLTITAPMNGIIRNLQDLKVGESLNPDKNIFEIIPVDHIEAELKVSSTEAKKIEVGQQVYVKVTAYEPQFNGTITGKVSSVLGAPLLGESNQPYYTVRIMLDKSYVGTDPQQNLLTPRMVVKAEILTGEKKGLDYILDPLKNIIKQSY